MCINICIPQVMTLSDFLKSSDRNGTRKEQWIDFSKEKIKKALFLDIDGVIQPFTNIRHEKVKDIQGMETLYIQLESRYGVDYRLFDKYDVAAVVYDWNPNAVNRIKQVLDATGAKIVVSSNWREGYLGSCLPFLMRIHDLEKYLYGYTPIYFLDRPKYEEKLHYRAVEILEYLKKHPYIKKWVAIDDIDIGKGIRDNFVQTKRCVDMISEEEAEMCIKILTLKQRHLKSKKTLKKYLAEKKHLT